MKDLTKIKTPFGLIGKKTRKALQRHGGPYEVFQGGKWRLCIGEPLWVEHLAYRVGDYFEVRTHTTPEQAAAMQAAFEAKNAPALSPEYREIFEDVLARAKSADFPPLCGIAEWKVWYDETHPLNQPHPIFAAVKEWQEACKTDDIPRRVYARNALREIKVPS